MVCRSAEKNRRSQEFSAARRALREPLQVSNECTVRLTVVECFRLPLTAIIVSVPVGFFEPVEIAERLCQCLEGTVVSQFPITRLIVH